MKLYAHNDACELAYDLPSRIALRRYLAALPDGQRLEVDVRKPTKRRTLPQNARYWAGVTLIAEHTGHTKEEIHETFGQWFRTDRSSVGPLDPFPKIVSTAKMTTAEHSAYVDQCEAWSIEFLDIAFPTMEDDR